MKDTIGKGLLCLNSEIFKLQHSTKHELLDPSNQSMNLFDNRAQERKKKS